MKKKITLLCVAIIMIATFSACSKDKTTQEVNVTLADSYWKAVEFEGEETSEEFWADLFLWEDGSAYLRVSQASAESGYWGMRDVSDCRWALKDGILTLSESASSGAVFCTGNLKQNRLTLEYQGVMNLTIAMEQTEMPPYGAQWEIPELYGTWQMVFYTDTESGSQALEEPGRYVASEITIHPVGGADYWLVERIFDNNYHYTEMEYSLGIKRNIEGPIWNGCENAAWHAELGGANDPDCRYYVTFADGRLLLKKDHGNYPESFPLTFTAEYRFLRDYSYEYNPDSAEWEGDWTAAGEYDADIRITNFDSSTSTFDFSFIGYYENEYGALHTGDLAGTAYFTGENMALFNYTDGNGGEDVQIGFVFHDGLLLVSMSNPDNASFGLEVNMGGVYTKSETSASALAPSWKNMDYAFIVEHYQKFVDAGGTEEAADLLLDNLASELGYRYEEQLYSLYASISELHFSYNDMGYAIRDINDDGIPDLFILAGEFPEIVAIYTLREDKPVLVGAYWSRNRIALDSYGTLYNSGSSGAANSSCSIYTINTWQDGELLILIEKVGIEDYDEEEMEKLPEPRYYRVKDGTKTIISEEEADAAWKNFYNAYPDDVRDAGLAIVPIM